MYVCVESIIQDRDMCPLYPPVLSPGHYELTRIVIDVYEV
jgi:hypothetical protein